MKEHKDEEKKKDKIYLLMFSLAEFPKILIVAVSLRTLDGKDGGGVLSEMKIRL